MPTLDDSITDPIAALPRHTIQYRILNNYRADPLRTVEVYASVEEIAFFREQGYLVRESLFTPAPTPRRANCLVCLKDCIDQELY